MTPRKRRTQWTRNAQGGWTRSLGQRGARVRLFQNRRNGTFYRSVWNNGRDDVRSLATADRDEAERLGRDLLAALLTDQPPVRAERLTLGQVWDRYRTSEAYRDVSARTQDSYAKCMGVVLEYFGTVCDIQTITDEDVRAYRRARRRGGLRTASGMVTKRVRERAVEYDLVVLTIVLRWATTVRTASGARWLSDNPLRGIRRRRELNPRRPVATWERFVATRQAMHRLRQRSGTEEERRRWWRMELALVLAEATGRRLSAIRNLRWDDIDWEGGTIHFRAEHDKKGRRTRPQVPRVLLDELRSFRRRLGAVGGLLFPQKRDPRTVMDRHLFNKWLTVAGADCRVAEAGRQSVARLPPEVGHRTESSSDQACRGGWGMGRLRHDPHLL